MAGEEGCTAFDSGACGGGEEGVSLSLTQCFSLSTSSAHAFSVEKTATNSLNQCRFLSVNRILVNTLFMSWLVLWAGVSPLFPSIPFDES